MFTYISKHIRRVRINLREIIFLILGICAATFGLKGFLLPNGFLDGGVTGISLLLNRTTHINISLLIVVLNIPL